MNANYRVTLHSIADFDNLRLVLVNYFILPLVSLGTFLLIAYHSSQNYERVLLGTVITSGIASAVGIISVSAVYDQNIGVIKDIVSVRPHFRYYWLPKFVIAAAILVVEILLLGIVGLITLHEVRMIPKLILALPLTILVASLLGYVGTVLGLGHENPYWLINLLTGSLVLLSGVVLPLAQYPLWLRVFAELLPVSNLLDWVMTPTYLNQTLLLIILKLLIWSLVWLGSTHLFYQRLQK